jgi:hypothetical protein
LSRAIFRFLFFRRGTAFGEGLLMREKCVAATQAHDFLLMPTSREQSA